MTFPKQEMWLLHGVVKSMNELRRAQVSTNFHASRTVAYAEGDFRDPTVNFLAVASANATDEPTLVTLCKELRVAYAKHLADRVGHKVADATNVVAAAEPTVLAGCITLLNELKADYNAHRASTTFHYTADATNTITSVDATDQTSANTLANELKTDFNAHLAGALAGFSIQAEP
jgi:hypothetical protein